MCGISSPPRRPSPSGRPPKVSGATTIGPRASVQHRVARRVRHAELSAARWPQIADLTPGKPGDAPGRAARLMPSTVEVVEDVNGRPDAAWTPLASVPCVERGLGATS
jgi:hypothetical protein